MRIAGISESLNDSDGIGVVIYFQGCSKGCKGCHNPELQAKMGKDGALDIDLEEAKQKVFPFIKWMDNLVLQGGEPLEQDALELIGLCTWAKGLGKKIWLFTGWTLDEVPQNIKDVVDVIKDGPYVESLKSELPFRGSSNQKIWRKVEGEWRC